MDRDFCTAIAIFDFSKAFHSVPDCCLFSKLNQYYLCGRPGSVLKPKPRPRFCGRPNQNRKSVFTGPSRFLSRTRQTKGVAHRLNDAVFGQPFVKRFALCSMLSDRCLSVLSVCDVRALWPNGWMDQDETWHAGRPRPWPHCVRWGPSSPSPKGAQPSQFSAHICCSQMAAWIKTSLGMELGLAQATLC